MHMLMIISFEIVFFGAVIYAVHVHSVMVAVNGDSLLFYLIC